MKVGKWPGDNRRRPVQEPGYMIRISQHEALRLVESFAKQLLQFPHGANSGRAEFYTCDGEYFSMVIVRDEVASGYEEPDHPKKKPS